MAEFWRPLNGRKKWDGQIDSHVFSRIYGDLQFFVQDLQGFMYLNDWAARLSHWDLNERTMGMSFSVMFSSSRSWGMNWLNLYQLGHMTPGTSGESCQRYQVSNLVWDYATLDVCHEELFAVFANYTVCVGSYACEVQLLFGPGLIWTSGSL